ncbi:glycosyltransferase [Neobacillus niacini]|uniref:CgeB family protein n=1 Tax=Neobacillus niacini TaxID=86668 RepID=UPI0028573B56|nr:glycosyltransferase [Neobacillus niacini]MDR7001026.1 spore maturation protein CgeB [Neobacillus niacini]
MKILFIPSAYKGIYEWFEKSIITALRKNHEIRMFHIHSGFNELKIITQRFKPDLVLTLVGFKFPLAMVQWLKKQEILTAVWFTEDPYYMDRTVVLSRYYDYVFSIDSAAVDYYKNRGHDHAYLLSLATSPEVFFPKQIEPKYKSDICMVGFPYPERVRDVQRLLKNTPYKIQVVGKWINPLYKFRQNPNLKIHEGWVEPKIVSDFYNGAKIVLNTHRPYNLQQNMNQLGIVGKSINNRAFDVASSAAFQLIESKVDLNEHFIENEEIVSFNNFSELSEKIHYYMNADDERKLIANKARERVLKEHTFEKRLNKMMSLLNLS